MAMNSIGNLCDLMSLLRIIFRRKGEEDDDGNNYLCSLPQHILFEILTRLCPRTLAKLRCVSKFFDSVIVDQEFNDDYVWAHSTSTGGPTILISFTYLRLDVVPGRPMFDSLNYTGEVINGNVEEIRVENIGGLFGRGYSLRSFADGMVCFSSNDVEEGDIIVCHVSTGQHISLPKTRGHHHPLLGFDSVSRRYKVLMSSSLNKQHSVVFTVGVDKTWREIENEVDFDPHRPTSFNYRTSVHTNGVIYALNNDNVGKKFNIVAFDVKTETFSVISLPEDDEYDFMTWKYSFVEIEGRLGITHLTNDNMAILWTLEKSCMEWRQQRVQISPIVDDFYLSRLTSNSGKIQLCIPRRRRFVYEVVDEFKKPLLDKFEVRGILRTVNNGTMFMHMQL